MQRSDSLAKSPQFTTFQPRRSLVQKDSDESLMEMPVQEKQIDEINLEREVDDVIADVFMTPSPKRKSKEFVSVEKARLETEGKYAGIDYSAVQSLLQGGAKVAAPTTQEYNKLSKKATEKKNMKVAKKTMKVAGKVVSPKKKVVCRKRELLH